MNLYFHFHPQCRLSILMSFSKILSIQHCKIRGTIMKIRSRKILNATLQKTYFIVPLQDHVSTKKFEIFILGANEWKEIWYCNLEIRPNFARSFWTEMGWITVKVKIIFPTVKNLIHTYFFLQYTNKKGTYNKTFWFSWYVLVIRKEFSLEVNFSHGFDITKYFNINK